MLDLSDPLLYSEEQLNELTDEELNELYDNCVFLESRFNTEQMGLKILINSLYGALANKWFPLFNEKMAQAITGNGRYFIRMLADRIESALQKMHKSNQKYIISGDTDSVYYTIEPFMNMYKTKNPNATQGECVDWADMFEKKIIQPVVNDCISELCENLNAYNSEIIGAEREVISDVGVIAEKKKYYIRVLDSEGVRYTEGDPYIKIMGLEAIKSSTPEWSKKYLKESIPHILDKSEGELNSWIRELKNNFTKIDLNKIAIIGGVSRLDYKDTDKAIPIGSRASICHNKYIDENNLQDVYDKIQPGDKCKRIFLTSPNIFKSNIVAYNSERFTEDILKHNCVDYDTQFQKGFLNPIKLMTNCLNYNLERETETFDDW